MVKMIALYTKPEDPEAFDKEYMEKHVALVKSLPGLRKVEIARIQASPIGEVKGYLVTEMYFDSMEALNAANASPEGKATARHAMQIAAKNISIYFAEVHEGA
jgi:uncharacterized protein (TIGR02118 family)